MTALVLGILAVAAPPQGDLAKASEESMPAHELRAAVRSALAVEARAPDRDARLLAVAEVVRLYGRLKTNPHIAYRDRIRLRAKLRSRLNSVASDLKRESTASANRRQSSSDSNATGAAGGAGVADPGQVLVDLIESTIRPASWRDAGGAGVAVAHGPRAAGALRGGGAAAGAGGFGGGIHGGGGSRGAAQAEALIELIQNTIRPESWEVNGGRGTIMYWPGS